MGQPQSIDQRLREYAAWKREPALHVSTGGSIFGKIRDEQFNAGARGDGIKPDIIDGVSCRPDGGMTRIMDDIGRELARDNRCRDIEDLMRYLPEQYRAVYVATYGGLERRSERVSAELLKVKRNEYVTRRAALWGWFEGAMFRVGIIVTVPQSDQAQNHAA